MKDITILTKDQRKAYEGFKTFLSSKKKFKTLAGYAGTGKTFLLDYFVEYAKTKRFKTIVTATTNPAVAVLMGKVSDHDEFSTIHSLLNIKPVKKGSKEIFKPDKYGDNDITEYDLVIIDECSMISMELLNIISEELQGASTKVLFVGDPAQLQPINEKVSHSFKYEPLKLFEIVRHGDIIANQAKLVRNNKEFIYHRNLFKTPDVSVIVYEHMMDLFKGFKENPRKVRMLTWTNDAVHYWNRIFRAVDWGFDPEVPFMEGDIVVANSPCENHDRIIMNNFEEGVVQSVDEYEHYYKINVHKNIGHDVYLRVIKDNYIEEWKQSLKTYAKNKDWGNFWYWSKFYHDIRHCYALTTHKAQGSSIENVIMDIYDMNQNYDIENKNQLLYVAMTRAEKFVYFYEK